MAEQHAGASSRSPALTNAVESGGHRRLCRNRLSQFGAAPRFLVERMPGLFRRAHEPAKLRASIQ